MIDKTTLQEFHSLYILSLNLNMQKTVEDLKIPKSTLKGRLDTLEKRLGGRLFERSQKSGAMSLTSFGAIVFPKIKQILWIAESLSFEEIFSKGKVIPITVVSNPIFLEKLNLLMADFLEKNPNIILSFKHHSEAYYQPHNLNEIFIGCMDDDPEYDYRTLFEITPKLWASKNYLENNPSIQRIEDLKGHTLIMTTDDFRSDSVLKKLSPIMSQLKIIETPDSRTNLNLATNNAGIIIESDDIASKFNLTPVLPNLTGDTIQFTIKTNKEFLKFPCAQSVVEWILESVRL